MEELTHTCSSLTVTDKHFELYKPLPMFDQNKRREELLAEQKRLY